MTPNNESYERIPIYGSDVQIAEPQHLRDFREDSQNTGFRPSVMTWLSLFFLILVYPGVSLIFADDPSVIFNSLDNFMLMFMLISTVIMQWFIFLWLFVTLMVEKSSLAGLGFKRIRGMDFAWAISFLLASNLILSGLAWCLAQIGLPMPGEISLMIPQDTAGRIVWVVVSFTAGFCEETAFRGYLMTRLRLLTRIPGWIIPTVVSSLAFGACHAYQGVPGLIIISVYGVLFSLLYIRTGSIWPCIIAHFFQDFSALFIPQ